MAPKVEAPTGGHSPLPFRGNLTRAKATVTLYTWSTGWRFPSSSSSYSSQHNKRRWYRPPVSSSRTRAGMSSHLSAQVTVYACHGPHLRPSQRGKHLAVSCTHNSTFHTMRKPCRLGRYGKAYIRIDPKWQRVILMMMLMTTTTGKSCYPCGFPFGFPFGFPLVCL